MLTTRLSLYLATRCIISIASASRPGSNYPLPARCAVRASSISIVGRWKNSWRNSTDSGFVYLCCTNSGSIRVAWFRPPDYWEYYPHQQTRRISTVIGYDRPDYSLLMVNGSPESFGLPVFCFSPVPPASSASSLPATAVPACS